MNKQCPGCQRELPLDAFYRNKSHADGLTSHCKECHRADYLSRRETILANKKAKYHPHPKPKIPVADGKKQCSTCGEIKERTTEFFARARTFADGFHNQCKLCSLAYREQHKADAKRRHDEWNTRNPLGPKRWRIKIKAEMIAAYGGQCMCCGDSHPEFLTLDHIGGRTAENHPWDLRQNGSSIYGKLKKLGWPKNAYRLMCMNCNWAIRWGDPCPHSLSALSSHP
jgi:hypothetical protein